VCRRTWRDSDAVSSGLVSSMSVISARHASFFEELSDEGRRARSRGGDGAAAPSLLVLSLRPKEFSANSAKLSLQEGLRVRSLTRGGNGAAAPSLLDSVLRLAAPPTSNVPLQKCSRNWSHSETAVGGDML
jgi:hypothetical protein